MQEVNKVAAELQEKQAASRGVVVSFSRRGILVALLVVNGLYVSTAAYRLLSGPSSVRLYLSEEHVQVLHDSAGNEKYSVEVPVTEFPYDMELMQDRRFDLLTLSLVNLLGVGWFWWKGRGRGIWQKA